MNAQLDVAPCFHAEVPARGMLLADLNVAGFSRPRAVRARLRQGMAELSIELHQRPDVREVFAVIWTGADSAGPRVKSFAVAAAQGVHRRAEMLRGTPLGVAVVFADDRVPPEQVRQGLRQSARTVPDGVSAMIWPDVCAYGVHACAAMYRI